MAKNDSKSISPDKECKPDEDKCELPFHVKAKNYYLEYCLRDGVQGIPYIIEPNRTICEKLWWTIAISASYTFGLALIFYQYMEMTESPVTIAVSTAEESIWHIPFPSVTICPQTKADPKIFNYTSTLHKKLENITLTTEENVNFAYLSFICRYRQNIDYSLADIEPEKIVNLFKKVVGVNSTKDMFPLVSYMENGVKFEEYFTPILTDEGICYTFNMLDRKDIFTDVAEHYEDCRTTKFQNLNWDPESGYRADAGVNAYPKRTPFAGEISSLEVWMAGFKDTMDYTCSNGFNGFKVRVHTPDVIPLMKRQHFKVPMNHYVVAKVTPHVTKSSDKIRGYTPEQRGCFFASEKKLKYFKTYTKENCAIECRANYTLKYCGCVGFYMPRGTSEPICSAAMIKCIKDSDWIREMCTLNSWKPSEEERKIHKEECAEEDDCHCLPECNSLYFDADVTHTNFKWKKLLKAEKVNINPNEKSRFSRLKVFFLRNRFVPQIRQQKIRAAEWIVGCLAYTGYFMSTNFLSAVSFIYYFTLRILCNFLLHGKPLWSGSPVPT